MMRRRWWFPFDGRGSFLEYCLVAWHFALIPSIALAALAYLFFSSAGADVSALQKPARDILTRNVWMTVLVAPAIETLVLACGIWLIGRVTRRRQVIAVTSALAWVEYMPGSTRCGSSAWCGVSTCFRWATLRGGPFHTNMRSAPRPCRTRS